MSTGIVEKSRLTNAFNKLQSAYSLSRSNSMSKSVAADLVIRCDGKYYYCQSGSEEEEKMGIANYSMKFVVYDESTDKETTYESFEKMMDAYGNTTARTITIGFTRSGKLEPLKDGDDVYLSQIWLDDKVMYITYETGKYSLEK